MADARGYAYVVAGHATDIAHGSIEFTTVLRFTTWEDKQTFLVSVSALIRELNETQDFAQYTEKRRLLLLSCETTSNEHTAGSRVPLESPTFIVSLRNIRIWQ
jgi:hypothetical protein